MDVYFQSVPGIVYDLMQILTGKLNEDDKWMSQVADTKGEEKEIPYIKFWQDQFEKPVSQLAVFFYLKGKDANSNYFYQIFMDRLKKCGIDVDKEDFMDYLSDHERIKKEICEFYFKKEVDYDDLICISREVNGCHKLDENMKFLLLSFFIDSDLYIQKLRETFSKYFDQINGIYEAKATELRKRQEECRENLDIASICKKASISSKKKGSKQEIRRSIVSLAVINKTALWSLINRGTGWLILGEDYYESLPEQQKTKLDVQLFCDAIADQNRIKAIELMLAEGEQSSGDLARKLNVAANTISYHMDVMRKGQLIKSRGAGRLRQTVYWLNPEIFSQMVDLMRKWIQGENL